jgi:transcriptional regulator with XRE-family HTH domain
MTKFETNNGGFAMDAIKRQRLEEAGWKVGTADEFLELSPEESALLDVRLKLGQHIKQLRVKQKLSQKTLAKRLGSSQSRVSKIEAGDPSTSFELLFTALFAVKGGCQDVAEAFISCGFNPVSGVKTEYQDQVCDLQRLASASLRV